MFKKNVRNAYHTVSSDEKNNEVDASEKEKGSDSKKNKRKGGFHKIAVKDAMKALETINRETEKKHLKAKKTFSEFQQKSYQGQDVLSEKTYSTFMDLDDEVLKARVKALKESSNENAASYQEAVKKLETFVEDLQMQKNPFAEDPGQLKELIEEEREKELNLRIEFFKILSRNMDGLGGILKDFGSKKEKMNEAYKQCRENPSKETVEAYTKIFEEFKEFTIQYMDDPFADPSEKAY